jgi:DNA polymerase I-like protein with 3'-5' exonuclease and polymerase domains
LRFNVPITNDRDLEQALATGDVYAYDAAQVFGELFTKDTNEKRKKQTRKQIKIVHLAFQYAAGTPAVYTQALVRDRSLTYSKVKAFHNKLKSVYPATTRYWETELKKVMACGYSEGLLLGTRVYYPAPPAITETANKPIQTTAAESMALAMCAIEDRLTSEVPRAYFVNILHDAFDIETPEEDADKVVKIMHEEMEGPWLLSNGKKVFVPVEHKVNKNWGKV